MLVRQFQRVPTYDAEKIRKHFEINAIQVACPLHLHLYNMSINIKIPVTMLQIVYIYMTALSSDLIPRTNFLQTWYFHNYMYSKFTAGIRR